MKSVFANQLFDFLIRWLLLKFDHYQTWKFWKNTVEIQDERSYLLYHWLFFTDIFYFIWDCWSFARVLPFIFIWWIHLPMNSYMNLHSFSFELAFLSPIVIIYLYLLFFCLINFFIVQDLCCCFITIKVYHWVA